MTDQSHSPSSPSRLSALLARMKRLHAEPSDARPAAPPAVPVGQSPCPVEPAPTDEGGALAETTPRLRAIPPIHTVPIVTPVVAPERLFDREVAHSGIVEDVAGEPQTVQSSPALSVPLKPSDKESTASGGDLAGDASHAVAPTDPGGPGTPRAKLQMARQYARLACALSAAAIVESFRQMLRRLAGLRQAERPYVRPIDVLTVIGWLQRLSWAQLRLQDLARRMRWSLTLGAGIRMLRDRLARYGTAELRDRFGRTVLARSPAGRATSTWLKAAALMLGLLVLALRAGLASASLMAPGGEIIGWSRVPVTHCAICQLPSAAALHSGQTSRLTPLQYARILAQRLSLDQQLGQLLLVQFAGQDATPDAIQMVNTQDVGAVISFALNIRSEQQVRALTTHLQQAAPVPLIIAVDQEGGAVNRFRSIIGSVPTAASLSTAPQVYARGEQDAALLHTYGYNLNLAPVVDVDGASNPELYGRTFGTDPNQVATMAGAYLAGLQESGAVTGCLKHFPGLGATTTDPHRGLPVLRRSRDDWERIDLAPYRMLLAQQDVRVIMVSHEMIPAVDATLPTSLSPTVIDGTLRGELGYHGVVITDSLYMGALASHWSVAQASVLAIKAGADMVMGAQTPSMVAQIKAALKQALASGELTPGRIEASVERILALKIEMGLILLPQPIHGGAQALVPLGEPVDVPRQQDAGRR